MATNVLPERPLTIKQIVHRYKGVVTAQGLYKAIAEGRLKARHKAGETKTWYVREEDLAEYLDKGMWGER